MKRFFKKSLALILMGAMLLPTSVTAREVAPTVTNGGNAKTEVETAPTVTTEEEKTTTVEETTENEAKKKTEKKTSTTKLKDIDVMEKVDEKVKETELKVIDETEKMTKELLIKADKKSEIPKDGKVLSSYEDTYLVSFLNTDTAKEVYEDKNTDASLNIPFGIATGNDKASTVVEPDVLDNLEETLKADDTKGFKITDEDYSIAVIDTGMPKSSKNVEFVSMLDDKGYDDHGHGTMMLESIRKQNADAKILSIKALDKNGYGDAATIYAAIKYAIERNVDVINLSISGFATEGNKCIEEVIKEAVKQGIIVVGAAGNDNLPASAFIPGGIDEAIIVGACNEKNERKLFSNYGITVDYYADAGSTSEASAIVAGTLSANNGDIKALDDTFFKTPDLSIFEEDLKKYRTSDKTDKDDLDDNEEEPGILSEDSFLLNYLHKYINTGGRFHAADVSILLGDGTYVQNNQVDSNFDGLKVPLNEAFANYHCYAVDYDKINIATIKIEGQGWGPTDSSYTMIWNTSDSDTGVFVKYTLSTASSGKVVVGSGTDASAPPVKVTIPNCVIDLNDGSLHDWVIDIQQAYLYWGDHTSTGYKASRKDLLLMEFETRTIPGTSVSYVVPQFVTGANAGSATSVDARNEIWFTQSVSGAAADGVFLTGFKDLDQPHWFPHNDTDVYVEGLRIDNKANIIGQQIWTQTGSEMLVYGSAEAGHGSSLVLEANIQYTQSGDLKNSAKANFVAGLSATGTAMKWYGARCQTDIGLDYDDVVAPVTVNTYLRRQDVNGNWSAYALVDPNCPFTAYRGTVYSYTYGGVDDTQIYGSVTAGDTTTGAYLSGSTITYSMQGNTNFYLDVPRKKYTYTFNANPPSGRAATEVSNMPSNRTDKWAQTWSGNLESSPTLSGWTFKGFYEANGAAYTNEEMLSNKTFYARWEATCRTFLRYQNKDGSYPTYAASHLVHSQTCYSGDTYTYTYNPAGVDTVIYDVDNTEGYTDITKTHYNKTAKKITFAVTGSTDFHLQVPRKSYTYTFHENRPANATSTVTNMPDNITKLAENTCGEYNREPKLKGWIFKGFYTTAAATGGDAYNKDEEMKQNKDFWARWEPMKYYIRYNANGETNFNENATNGMQDGEYKQNATGGATAYQIFTYDEAGDALRQNGFTRKGYTYECWNTTAIRTGTDRNPGYVKPANVNWINGDGTDTNVAKLDGAHTYPVVDLYAVWRQKLGKELLTVVSEETGNPVKDVNLKFINTYNNSQITTATTNANGQVTVSNLHWFPYKWASTSVPAGYKNMQDVTFSINPVNTSDESFLDVTNERILYMKHVKLTINSVVDDIIKDENAPSFMYHITGNDVAGVAHSYDVMVQTSTGTKKGTNIVPVDSGSEEPYMFAGNYTVTQYDVSRYKPKNAINVSHTTPLGANANVNLTDYTSAEVTFPYGIDQYGGFSGVHSLINKLLK